MAEIKYQRLSSTWIPPSSLWSGPDHLLCVTSNGYAEKYKRFYFRDIQAISVLKTKRRMIWNVILLIPLFFSLVGLLICLSSFTVGGVIGWSIVAIIFLVPAAINNIRGATCATQLRTAVQIEELPSLRRIRRTHKVLGKIRPLIASAQGQFTAGEISAWMSELISPGSSQPDNAPPVIS